MTTVKTIGLADILMPERLRAVEDDHALAIQASIVEQGLLNPITVRATPAAERPYTLVAGAHRLRAVELLDDGEEIDSIVVKGEFGAFVATEDFVRAAYPADRDLPGQPALVVAKLAQRARTKLKAVGLTIEGGAGNGGRRLIWHASRKGHAARNESRS